MILRELEPGKTDRATLTPFACSTGSAIEDEVEEWVRATALPWLHDLPRATFQRRVVAFIDDDDDDDDDDGDTIAVVAWQDIVRVDLGGIWLQVLAVGLEHQNTGAGRAALDVTLAHLHGGDRDDNHVAGLVHPDNVRSRQLLRGAGWRDVAVVDAHELWVARL